MAAPSHDPLRMNILPAPVADKRQQAADERLTESASESERVIEFNSALAYFLKVFMGCGIYAIPAAALISEIHLGISLIIGAYVIVALCLYIVMKTANGSKSYPEFIKKTFDNGYGYFPKTSKIFEIFVIIIGFGFSLCICSVYLIFIVSHICKVVYVWHYMNPFENDANELAKFEFELDAVECRWWIPMAATVLVIFCFLPIWSKIALYIVALVGAIFQMAVIVLGFVYAIHYDVTDISVHQSWDLSNLFLVQSIAIYAGEGITTIFPLMAVMREPEKFLSSPSLLCSSMITVTAFAIIVVIVGAERLHILLNVYLCFFKRPFIDQERILKLMIAVTLICTYPIQLDAAYNYIANALEINKKTWIQYGLRLLLVLGTIIFALIHYAYLIFFMGIIGSLLLSFLVLIIPGLVPFCTKSYGKWYWKAVVGALAFGIGILVFVGGTIKNAVTWIDLAYSRNKAT